MPKDTVRELRINLISVKDHSKYLGGGWMGVGSSLDWEGSQSLRVPVRSGPVRRHVVMWAGEVRGHHLPGEVEPDRRRSSAAQGPRGRL